MAAVQQLWGRVTDRIRGGGTPPAIAALDIGTEFAKALVLSVERDPNGRLLGVVRGAARRRQGLSHMQSGTVSDIDAVAANCREDLATAEIAGSLTWEAYRVDPDAVRAAAEERFAADDAARPEGHELLPESTRVALGEVAVADGEVTVQVEVVGRTAPVLSRGAIADRVAGLTATEAEGALAPIGAAEVTLGPAWASTVPELDWRVDVQIAEAGA